MTSDSFYLHSDIPPGMTLDEYRRSRPREPSALRRVMAVGNRRSGRGKSGAGRARSAGGHGRAGTLP